MTLYKVVYTRKGRKVEMEPLAVLGYAQTEAAKLKAGSCDTIVILRNSQGTDHPDNDGKYFLHQIVK